MYPPLSYPPRWRTRNILEKIFSFSGKFENVRKSFSRRFRGESAALSISLRSTRIRPKTHSIYSISIDRLSIWDWHIYVKIDQFTLRSYLFYLMFRRSRRCVLERMSFLCGNAMTFHTGQVKIAKMTIDRVLQLIIIIPICNDFQQSKIIRVIIL